MNLGEIEEMLPEGVFINIPALEDQLHLIYVEDSDSLQLADRADRLSDRRLPTRINRIPHVVYKFPNLRRCAIIGLYILPHIQNGIRTLRLLILNNVHFEQGVEVIDFLSGFPQLEELTMFYVTSEAMFNPNANLTCPLQTLSLASNHVNLQGPSVEVRFHDHLLRWIASKPVCSLPITYLHMWDVDNSTANLAKEVVSRLSQTLISAVFLIRPGHQYAFDYLSRDLSKKESEITVVKWENED